MKYITRALAIFLPALVIMFYFSPPATAVYLDSGSQLALPKGKVINETVAVSAAGLSVDSDINGDLLCAGKDVTVNGNIKGDVLCAAQSIKINGNVDGNIRVIAQSVEISGLVSRNVYALSQNLSLTKFSSVKGDIFFGVQNVDLRGSLGRDLLGGADQLIISGSLLRNAKVMATRVSLVDPGKIGGDFEYYIDNTGTASVSQKNVKGNIVRHEIVRKETPQDEMKNVSLAARCLGKIFWALSTILIGLVVIYFLKPRVLKRVGIIASKPVVVGLIGLAVLILTPFVILLLLISVIGAPLAVVLLLEYIISIMLSAVYPSILVGGWMIKSLTKKKSDGLVWPFIAGTVIIGLLMFIPPIGLLTGFIFLCLGLGATFLSYLPEK
ncbi:MAG: hypothetical protein ACD_61C00138G0002 [uncultured bacterium]|nr:MAG: hypothetical protein ACD_61C00138G0002 [uncultured bacterium]